MRPVLDQLAQTQPKYGEATRYPRCAEPHEARGAPHGKVPRSQSSPDLEQEHLPPRLVQPHQSSQ